MQAAWMRARAELRASWKTIVAVTLLVGLGAGLALTALAGARRTQTAMHRFVAFYRPTDLVAQFNPDITRYRSALHAPEVAVTTRTPFLLLSSSRTHFDGLAAFGAADDDNWRTVQRPLVLRGRLPAPSEVDAAVVNDDAVRERHYRLGQSLTLYSFSLKQLISTGTEGFNPDQRPAGPSFTVRIVGVIRQPTDISVVPVHQDVAYESHATLYVTRAFTHRYAARVGFPSFDQLPGNDVVYVRLRHGAADIPAFERDATRVAKDAVQISPGSDARTAADAAQRGIDLEAVALVAFGGLALVATVAVSALILARQLRADRGDREKLAAMGMTRGQLVAAAMACPVVAAVFGAALALVVSVGLSPLTPIGIARQAEIHRGVAINSAISVGGFALVVVALVACLLVPASRASSPARSRRMHHRPRAGASARPAFVPVSATLATPARRTFGAAIAVAFAVASIAGVLTFSANLTHLVNTPRLQGWNFDVLVGNLNDQSDQVPRYVPKLEHNPLVGGFSSVAAPLGEQTLDGRAVGLVGVDARRGNVYPPVLEGRPPAAPDEVMLGTRTLAELHKHIGDTVRASVGAHTTTLRVVGRMMNTSAGDVLNGRLDEGGVVTLAGLAHFGPKPIVNLFVVRYARGANAHAAYLSLRRDFGSLVLQHVAAQDVENVARVAALPALLAALIALLAVAAMTHALVTSVRRGRKDFAIARACGFVRRQLAATVMWQTWWLALCGLVAGIPLGIIAGRFAWQRVATDIGTIALVRVPVGAILVIVPAGALLATLVALLPAWQAAHVAPARMLRGE